MADERAPLHLDPAEVARVRVGKAYPIDHSRGLSYIAIARLIPAHASLYLDGSDELAGKKVGITVSREAIPLLAKINNSPKTYALEVVMDRNGRMPSTDTFCDTDWKANIVDELLMFGLDRRAELYNRLAEEPHGGADLFVNPFLENPEELRKLAKQCKDEADSLRERNVREISIQDIHTIILNIAAYHLRPLLSGENSNPTEASA